MKGVALLVAALPLMLLAGACATMENAAAKDPMRCERDPSCQKAKSAYPDCSRQCADDPECVDRCRQVQQGTDSLGHPQ
jgi:hypothetical protein